MCKNVLKEAVEVSVCQLMMFLFKNQEVSVGNGTYHVAIFLTRRCREYYDLPDP